MRDPAQPSRIEPRWPAALAILAVLLLLTVLPGRVRLFPVWVPFVVVIAVLLPMAGVTLAAARARWLRVERAITLLFVVAMGLTNFSILAYLVRTMVKRPGDIGGLQLLTSSIAVWVTNVLVFSLLFWHMDRGGPEARANDAGTKPDWLFPQSGAPEDAPPDWRPTFVDYLFLAFSTATAFSPTDVLPLTSRAKLLMMIESGVSLVTIVTVAARAINLLSG